MLVIRYQRVGRKNDPAFRIVVTEKANAPQGKHHEIVGSYHPKTKHIALKEDRIKYWLSQGAQLSPTLNNLLVAKKVIGGKKIPVAVKRRAAV